MLKGSSLKLEALQRKIGASTKSLPDWFDEIVYIQSLIELERDWGCGEGKDPHPTAF